MFEIAGGVILAVIGLAAGGALLWAALRNARGIGVALCVVFVIAAAASLLAG